MLIRASPALSLSVAPDLSRRIYFQHSRIPMLFLLTESSALRCPPTSGFIGCLMSCMDAPFKFYAEDVIVFCRYQLPYCYIGCQSVADGQNGQFISFIRISKVILAASSACRIVPFSRKLF